MTQLADLLAEAEASPLGLSRGWIERDPLSVYVRIGPRWIKSKRVCCVQIANVSVHKDKQHQGVFTAFLNDILGITTKPVFIENVMTHQFKEGLLRRNFEVVNDGHIPCDMILRRV